MLIGDAAGFTSPLFEGGSHLALKSAVFAAQTAVTITSGNLTADYLAEYASLWKRIPPYNKILSGKTFPF